jgi:hypothetical protein
VQYRDDGAGIESGTSLGDACEYKSYLDGSTVTPEETPHNGRLLGQNSPVIRVREILTAS